MHVRVFSKCPCLTRTPPPKFLMRLCFLEHPHSPADVIVNFFSLNFGTGDMSTTQQILILVVDCYRL